MENTVREISYPHVGNGLKNHERVLSLYKTMPEKSETTNGQIERVKELEEAMDRARLWMAEHDGRINAYWDEQHRHNKNVDDEMRKLATSLNALERRVVTICGIAAGAGSVIGTILSTGIFN